MMMVSEIFTHPVQLNSDIWTLLLVIPLCASVVVVYKTVRTENLRRLPFEIVTTMAYVLGGLAALGVVLWLGYSVLT